MSRRTYKDAGRSGQELTGRQKKKGGGLKLLLRFAILCAVLLLLYALVLNWKSIAPDSFVAWVDDLVDGTTGGSWPVALTGDTVFDMQEAGANLVMVTDTAVKYYNQTGGESVRRTCAYASPMLRITDKYVLILEAGGNRYRLETRSQIEGEYTVSGKIYTGAVSAKGDVAVVTDSSQSHVSEVTVYSRSGNRRYQWLSAEWLVMDVSFSRDGNTMAVVGCRAQNGAMQSAVMVFDLRGKEEQPAQYIADGVLYSRVQYMKSGTVAAIGNSQTRFVNPTGSLDSAVMHSDVELIGFALGGNELALVTRPYGSQDGGTVTVYASSGDVKVEGTFEGEFRDIAATNKGFLVLSDEHLYELGSKGITDRAPVLADSLMTGTVEGKALVLGLTQLTLAEWESQATAAPTTTTVATTAPTTASTTVMTSATTEPTTTTSAPTEDEPYEDETYEDETYEDETYEDETYEDETYEDESYEEEPTEEE